MQLYYLSVYLVAKTLNLSDPPHFPNSKNRWRHRHRRHHHLSSFLPSFLPDRPTDPSTIFSSLPIPIGTKIFFFHVRERASCGGGRLALSALRRRGAAVSTFTCWFILGTAATAAADDAGGMAAASAMPRPSIDSGRLVELKVDIQL